jgi:signal transduction histidine kinase
MRMRAVDRPGIWAAVIVAAFLGLLPLAWLQYRWIGRIAEADRERRHAHLAAAVRGVTDDFDGEINQTFRSLMMHFGRPAHPDFEGEAARYTRAMETLSEPRLVRALYVVRGGDLFRLNADAVALEPAAWPPELERLRARLAAPPHEHAPGAPPWAPLIDGGIPAIVAPRVFAAPPFMGRRRPGPPGGAPAALSILYLDLDFISKELLPSLVRRHFRQGDGSEYHIRIVNARESWRVIYTSDATLPADFFAAPDFAAPLLDVRGRRPRFAPPVDSEPAIDTPHAPPPWLLLVKHRAGSLDAVVAQARRRNLAVSMAILSLMAASLAVLLVSTRRARRLAEAQMEFVAGVSHELRTPLSVICSAADNLADGVVSSEGQVRRYGSVIRGEGRRLSRMVEQILGFAGIQSGRARYEMQPACIEGLLDKALATCEPEIRASGCTVERRVEEDIPPVLADPTPLVHCLRNLLDNAATHGKAGGWIGVRAGAHGTSVEVAVEDRGGGLDPADIPRIFEPFYRGRTAVKKQSHGFGLGLALARRIAEAHGGALAVENTGKGARFTLRLPAARVLSDGEYRGTEDSSDRG